MRTKPGTGRVSPRLGSGGCNKVFFNILILEEPFAPGRYWLHRLADVALAHLAEQRVRIQSGIMPVAPRDLERIPADRLNVHKHDQEWHIIRFKTKLSRPFIGAGGARTMLTKIPDRIDPLVPVIPFNAKHALLEPFHVFGFKRNCAHVGPKKLMSGFHYYIVAMLSAQSAVRLSQSVGGFMAFRSQEIYRRKRLPGYHCDIGFHRGF